MKLHERTVVGIFPTHSAAIEAVRLLHAAGFDPADIGLVAREASAEGEPTDHSGSGEIIGATAGGLVGGGVLGGLAGLLVGLGALSIPGIGPILAAGPLAAALGPALAGAGLGSATGGIVGVLTGIGVSEREAHLAQAHLGQGGVLVSVRCASPVDEENAREIVRRAGAEGIEA